MVEDDTLVLVEEQQEPGVKIRFSSFATQYLREMAKKEPHPIRKAQIETAGILYGHLAGGSIPTRASSWTTAKAMRILESEEEPAKRKGLDRYIAPLLRRKDIQVLNIGDPFLLTADKRVTVLDPVFSKKKRKSAKAVRGVFPATPFNRDSFDAIFCKNSIGYAMAEMRSEHAAVVMDELLRLTKQGGMILIDSIEFQRNDSDEREFSYIRSVLDDLKERGVVEYGYDQDINEAEAVGSVTPAANTWYTLRITKTSDYSPKAFPGDIMAEVASAYKKIES